jgi:adenylylsulfate kinase
LADGVVAWIVGLPSSGKSTLAARVASALRQRGTPTVELDGDALRACIVPEHGYGDRGRNDFYETLARTAALLARQGNVIVVSATASRAAFRRRARALWPRFIEVFVDVPLATCMERDAKGLYAAGVAALPGLKVTFEPPLRPEVVVHGADAAAVASVVGAIDTLDGAAPALRLPVVE